MYSFGYWGCGQATEDLVKAVNAAEHARGFTPPLWVDIRIRRTVRAAGFSGDAFEKLLGPRHRWIPDLGNESILDGADSIKIRNQDAAAELLDLAVADRQRHVIFFCACKHPREPDPEKTCHRQSVSRLLVGQARDRGIAVEVIEWPGGEPQEMSLQVAGSEMRRALQMPRIDLKNPGTLKRLRIPKSMSMATAAGIPWGSVAELNADGETGFALIGPARFGSNGAYLQVLASAATRKGATQMSRAWRVEHCCDALRTKMKGGLPCRA